MPLDPSPVIRFSDCEVHCASRVIRLGGVVQAVEPRTFDVIVFLISHRDRVVSKNELLERVWRNLFVSDTVVARSIMKARRAIGDDGERRILIRTAYRVGYQFVGVIAFAAEVPPADLHDGSSASDTTFQIDHAARRDARQEARSRRWRPMLPRRASRS